MYIIYACVSSHMCACKLFLYIPYLSILHSVNVIYII